MNASAVFTAKLNVGITPDLKVQLRSMARSQHRSLSNLVRMLLRDAVELEGSFTVADPSKSEYEIRLTAKQATRLVGKGYDLQVWEPKYFQLPLRAVSSG